MSPAICHLESYPQVILSGLKIHLNLVNIFIKKYNKDSDEGHFLEADVQYPEKKYELQNDFPFLPGRIKIEKNEKLGANLDVKKKEYVIHIRNFEQALNHGLVLKKVPRVIKFNQEASLKPLI